MNTLAVERRDVQIVCVDCGHPFIWTVAGQLFFERKDFARPKRSRTASGCSGDRSRLSGPASRVSPRAPPLNCRVGVGTVRSRADERGDRNAPVS